MKNEHVYFAGTGRRAVVFLHGYGADMHDLAPLQQYLDPLGQHHWYFPNGSIRIPFGGVWEGRAWFPIDMAELERAMQTGVPRDFAQKKPAEFLTALERLREEMLTLQQQYEDVIVGGFSQGAMMATHLANQLPLAGLVILSGTLLARELLMETHHHRTVPFFQSHGDQDQLLSLSQAHALNELLQEKGWPGVWAPFRGGHEIPRQVLDSLQHFLKQFT